MKYSALESWRGIAAIAIVIFHSPFRNGAGSDFLDNLPLFVDFFFVLSGFVMTYAYGQTIANGMGLGRFSLLRLGRLLPLHMTLMFGWLVLVLAGAQIGHSGLDDVRHQPDTFLINLALLNSFGLTNSLSWNYPSWSIGSELVAYFSFFLVVRAFGRRLTPAVALALSALAYLALAVASDETLRRTYDFGFLRCIGGFYLGVAVFLLHKKSKALPRSGTGSEVVALAIVALLLSVPVETAWQELFLFVAFAFMVHVFASSNGLVARLLNTAPLRYLGRISYSLYLVHALVFELMRQVALAHWDMAERVHEPLIGIDRVVFDTPHWLGINAFALGLIVALSALTFRFIEEPGRRSVARWRGRRQNSDHLAGV